MAVIVTMPPWAPTEIVDSVSSRAPFCFWVTFTVLVSSPQVRVTVAVRASYAVFSPAVTLITASPAWPLLGAIESQVSLEEATQSRVAENDTCLLSPSSESTIESEELSVISPFTGSGSGSVSLQPQRAMRGRETSENKIALKCNLTIIQLFRYS